MLCSHNCCSHTVADERFVAYICLKHHLFLVWKSHNAEKHCTHRRKFITQMHFSGKWGQPTSGVRSKGNYAVWPEKIWIYHRRKNSLSNNASKLLFRVERSEDRIFIKILQCRIWIWCCANHLYWKSYSLGHSFTFWEKLQAPATHTSFILIEKWE